MSTDLETLRGALRARADADVDASQLLARIQPAYRRRRARRALGAMAAVVVVIVSALLIAPRYFPDGYAIPGPAAVDNTAPDPAAIGADPLTIHFGVGRFPYPVETTTWSVQDGMERLSLMGNTVTLDNPHDHDDTYFFLDLTLAPATTTPTSDPTAEPEVPSGGQTSQASIAGKPAVVVTGTAPRSSLAATRVTWQPMTGTRAELTIRGPLSVAQALDFARTLRLDVMHRCALRVRPTTLPAGAQLTGCSTTANSLAGQLTVGSAQGRITISVSATGVFDGDSQGTGAPSSTQLPTLRNGWPYQELDPSGNTEHYTALIRVPDPYLDIFSQGGYGLADVLLVAGGLELSPTVG